MSNIALLRLSRVPAPTGPFDLDPVTFPDPPPGHGWGPPATIDNVRHLLAANGVVARYNVVRRRTELSVPWAGGTTENVDAVAMTHIVSAATRRGMPVHLVPAAVEAVADENSYNPAGHWVTSRPWDGESRLPAICATLTPREGYPLHLRDTIVTKWLLSATAAAVKPAGFRCRGVLTLQGDQGIGKTSWGLSLIDDPALRDQLIKVDHHLDPSSKDSLLGAIDHWLCEIGELDGSFRRDVARLKGFLTAGADKVRRPYARVAVEYQRRTVFYATVNQSDFLVDPTGNTRWWTIPCERIDADHGIDMQQVFAECAAMLADGAAWWLDPAAEAELERQNANHRAFSLVRDRLEAVVDREATDLTGVTPLTASEVLETAEIDRPTNGQAKECASILREWFGNSRRIQGRDRWRVPLRSEVEGSATARARVEGVVAPPVSKFD